MVKRKTFEEFEKDVINKYGTEYTVYPPYVNSKTKLKVKHNICGRTFETRPNNLLTGKGCSHCSNKQSALKRRKTTSQFIQELDDYYGKGHYEVLENYKTADTPIKVKHIDCGNIYKARPADIIRGHGCQKCAYKVRAKKIGDAHRYTLKQAKEQLNKYLGSDYQLMLNNADEYKGNRQHVPVKHLVCGNIYYPRMSDIQSHGSSCPICYGSTGEKHINNILTNEYHLKLNEDYYYGYIIPENKLHLDFYFPKLSLAIEYDGQQHYKPVKFWGGKKTYDAIVSRDLQKDKYCKSNGIMLYRIPYTINSYLAIKQKLNEIFNVKRH